MKEVLKWVLEWLNRTKAYLRQDPVALFGAVMLGFSVNLIVALVYVGGLYIKKNEDFTAEKNLRMDDKDRYATGLIIAGRAAVNANIITQRWRDTAQKYMVLYQNEKDR